MTVTEIQRRIQNAKDLDFGTIFNQSIELFKKVWVQGLVTLLLNMVLAIPVLMLVYIPLIITGLMDVYSNSYDPYDSYGQPDISLVTVIMMVILYLFAIIAMSTIGLALKSAFYRICKLKDLEQIGREDYFYFFKKPFLGKTIKLSLVVLGISIIASILYIALFVFLIASGNFESGVSIPLIFISLLPLIYIMIPLAYTVVIYAFNPEKSVSEIIKLSFDLGNKKWLITFGLMIVSGLLAVIVGMIMCFVGVYVTASFSYLPSYLIYKDVVGFDEEYENLQIEENVTF